MKTYKFSEARQNLAALLDEATSTGEVRISRRDGRSFVIRPARTKRSPLDVPGIGSGLSGERDREDDPRQSAAHSLNPSTRTDKRTFGNSARRQKQAGAAREDDPATPSTTWWMSYRAISTADSIPQRGAAWIRACVARHRHR